MDWITFLYSLLEKHVPLTPGQISGLKKEAENWYESDQVNSSKIGQFLKKWGAHWAVKTGLAIFFVFASRWMYDAMNPSYEPVD